MFVLGVIPARGGSKGIPRKNLYLLNGKPLIQYTIEAARNSRLNDFLVSSEDEEILRVSAELDCKYRIRPAELAADDTPTLPVLTDAVDWYESQGGQQVDAVMTLQPTSPLRNAADIDAALDLWGKEEADNLVSVYQVCNLKRFYDYDFKPIGSQTAYNRHKEKPMWQRNGAIFITRRDLLEQGRIFNETPAFYIMSKIRSIDIDDPEDAIMAEAIIKYGDSGL